MKQVSGTTEWRTPDKVFNKLDEEFRFTLDPCATRENHRTKKYFTKAQDGLKQSWAGERVFMNPPYGPGIEDWIAKARKEAKAGALVVGLVPARTDTKWFHEQVWHRSRVRFIKSRLNFIGGSTRAPFPSMIVIWGKA